MALWCWQSLYSSWPVSSSMSPVFVSQGGLFSGAPLCQTLHRPRVRRQNHQHQKALGQRWEKVNRHPEWTVVACVAHQNTKKQMHYGGFFIIMCVCVCMSQIWMLTLAYFSECLIPACEASTSVPLREAQDGFSRTLRRIHGKRKDPSFEKTPEISVFLNKREENQELVLSFHTPLQIVALETLCHCERPAFDIWVFSTHETL